MPDNNNRFFVLEGTDGSGKATQLELLKARLEAAGYDVAVFDFPRYSEPSSYFVKQYLQGNFGPASEVSPYTASLFYALDRFEAAPLIRQALSDGKIVLANRYVGSNMAHQGSKFNTEAEQRGFFLWADSLEFQLMGIPRPTLNLFLHLPTSISQEMIKSRAQKHGRSLDQHESNVKHLKRTLATFDLLCKLFPKDFKAINCAPNGRLLSVTDVSDLVWAIIKPSLPPPAHAGRPKVVKLNKPMAETALTQPSKTEAAAKVSDKGNSIKANNISLLMMNSLYSVPGLDISYDLLWGKSKNQSFYTPPKLQGPLAAKYSAFTQELLATYDKLEKQLLSSAMKSKQSVAAQSFADSLKSLVPMSAYANVEMHGDSAALEALVAKLSQSDLAEAKELLKIMHASNGSAQAAANGSKEASQMQRVDQLVKQFVDKQLPKTLPSESHELELSEILPRNEFELLGEGLYPYADQSYGEIKQEIDSWKYDQKLQAFELALHSPSNVLLQARYQFDVIDDMVFLGNLLGMEIVEQLEMQRVSPRFGYKLPTLIEDAGLEDEFLRCFDKSLELYSDMQAGGAEQFAAYSCLQGHKARWRFTTNAQLLVNALSKKLPDAQQEILKKLIALIGEQHPTLAKVLAEPAKAEPKASQPHTSQSKKRFRNRRKH